MAKLKGKLDAEPEQRQGTAGFSRSFIYTHDPLVFTEQFWEYPDHLKIALLARSQGASEKTHGCTRSVMFHWQSWQASIKEYATVLQRQSFCSEGPV